MKNIQSYGKLIEQFFDANSMKWKLDQRRKQAKVEFIAWYEQIIDCMPTFYWSQSISNSDLTSSSLHKIKKLISNINQYFYKMNHINYVFLI